MACLNRRESEKPPDKTPPGPVGAANGHFLPGGYPATAAPPQYDGQGWAGYGGAPSVHSQDVPASSQL